MTELKAAASAPDQTPSKLTLPDTCACVAEVVVPDALVVVVDPDLLDPHEAASKAIGMSAANAEVLWSERRLTVLLLSGRPGRRSRVLFPGRRSAASACRQRSRRERPR